MLGRMKTLAKTVVGMMLAASALSCTHYGGIAKADNQIYLTGGTTIVFITIPFIKRCDVEGTTLKCEELKEYEAPPPARRGEQPASTGTTTAATPAPSSSTPPAAP